MQPVSCTFNSSLLRLDTDSDAHVRDLLFPKFTQYLLSCRCIIFHTRNKVSTLLLLTSRCRLLRHAMLTMTAMVARCSPQHRQASALQQQ